MSDEMTPQERTARIAFLFMEMVNTLPTASSVLCLDREEIARREAAGRDYGEQINELARGAD